MPDIGSHTHYSPTSVLRDDLPNRFLAWPEGAGQGLIDDHNRFARFAIPLRKSSAGLQTDPERFEVSLAHHPNERFRRILALRVDLSLAGDLPRPVASEQRTAERRSDRLPGCLEA